MASCSPIVQITSRPIRISPSTTPGQYTATLTSQVLLPGGNYLWSTDNPNMVGFSLSTPSTGPSADHVTLVIFAAFGKAKITLTDISPCSGSSASDSFTFSLTDDVTVVAWVNAAAVSLDYPPNSATDMVVNSLTNATTCAATLLLWSQAGQTGVGIGNNGLTNAERIFANEFLISQTGNPPPSTQTQNGNGAEYVASQNYRFRNRFQTFFEIKANATIDSSSLGILQREFTPDGVTPEPCSGLQLFSKAVEDNTNDALYATTDASIVYQLKENRLGPQGQAVNQYLNGPTGGDFTQTTPWIWSVIQFAADGTTRPWLSGSVNSNLQIFPAFQTYKNGELDALIFQGNLMTFIDLNATSQYRIPQ